MAYIKSRKHAVARAVPPLTAAATLMALSLPAAAQQAGAGTLPSVQVQDSAAREYKTDNSANPKFTAPLVDTPQTIQVIPEQILREQGATTLSDAIRNTPGAGTFFLGENGTTSTGDTIYMRGFDTSGSIFVDGIRDIGSISRDTFNVEQVEVVKGPAGSDTGRSSPTGYINMITKKPTLGNAFLGSVSVGTDSFKRVSVDWNKELSSANGIGAAFRLNGVILDADAAGRDYVNNKRWGIAPSFAFGLNSPTRFYFDYVHLKQDNVPDGGALTIGLPGYSSPDAANRPWLTYASPVDPSNFYGTQWDFDNVSQDRFTARVEHDFTPDITLRNTFRYGKTKQDYMLSSFMASSGNLVTPSAALPLSWTIPRTLTNNKNQENTILTNQTNVSAKFNTGSVGHSLNAGLELIREEQTGLGFYGANAKVWNAPWFSSTGSFPVSSVYAPNPYVSGYLRIPNGTTTKGTTTTVGAYVFDTLKFNEQWSLTGGLRYDHYSTDYYATTLNASTGALTGSQYSKSGNLVTGKLGLVFKPTDFSSVYLGYATGAQPPGGSNFQISAAGTGNSANRADFDPQKTKTWELGTKWDVLNKKLALTAAIYRTEVSNEPMQGDDGNYYQTGKKRVQGVELGASGAVTDDWGVSAGFTTQDAKVLKGPSVLADGTPLLAYSPKNSFAAWTTYRLPIGLTVGLGARYNGELRRGSDGAVGTPKYVESYWVFDAMASYRINKNVDLQFNVYNLTDKDYVAAINKSGYRYTPGTPRTYRLTANFAF